MHQACNVVCTSPQNQEDHSHKFSENHSMLSFTENPCSCLHGWRGHPCGSQNDIHLNANKSSKSKEHISVIDGSHPIISYPKLNLGIIQFD